jgi:hypothetical protein
MTEPVQQEEIANPYNSKKDYDRGEKDKPFVSSDSLFYGGSTTEPNVEASENVQSETEN